MNRRVPRFRCGGFAGKKPSAIVGTLVTSAIGSGIVVQFDFDHNPVDNGSGTLNGPEVFVGGLWLKPIGINDSGDSHITFEYASDIGLVDVPWRINTASTRWSTTPAVQIPQNGTVTVV